MNGDRSVVQLEQNANICKQCHARSLCLTSQLNLDDLQHFDQVVAHPAPLRKGQRLFIAGDPIQSVFVLHSGAVKSYVESADGENQITGFHLPGEIIGLNGVDSAVHGDSVEALETSSVCEVRFEKADDCIRLFPGLQKLLSQYVLRELSHEQTLLLVLGKLSAQRRIAYFLLDYASRQQQRGLSLKQFDLPMTRHDIANYLGLAVETVSRIFTKLQNSGVLSVDRRSIEINNHASLENIYNNERASDEKMISRR